MILLSPIVRRRPIGMRIYAGVSTRAPHGAPGLEFIPFQTHRSIIAGAPHDGALDDEFERSAIVPTYRPRDQDFNGLSPWKSFSGCKEKTSAADIQNLASVPVRGTLRSNKSVLCRHPQGETMTNPAILRILRT